MSKITLQGDVNGTGTVTIAAPNTNTNRTLNLPDAAGTLLESSNPVVSQLNGGQLAGMRNKIINGKMEIAQRGTSFAAIANGAYSLDRWVYGNNTTAVATVTQQADVPTSNEFQFSYRYAVTTADTSIAASDNSGISQIIEGYNARDLIGRTFTLSFWVRSSKTGIHCIALSNSAQDRTYIAEYTISSANTWEYKTITVSGGLITAGTWDWTTGVGLRVRFTLASGSTFHTTAGTWQTGGFFATANQVNCLDTIGNIFAITGVQLEVGSVATPFEHRPYGAELALCQRYYARLTAGSGLYTAFASGIWRSGTNAQFCIKYPTTMRSPPTINYSGLGIDDTISTVAVTGLSSLYAGQNSAWQQFTAASGGTQSRPCVLCANNNTSAYLEMSSEL